MLAFFLLTFALVGAAVLAMAVGTIFSGRCLRGSCGGPREPGPHGEPFTCDTCSLHNRSRALRRRPSPIDPHLQ